MSWVGKAPKLTAEQAKAVRDVYRRKRRLERIRAAATKRLRELPTRRDLAAQLGVCPDLVTEYGRQFPKRYETEAA